MMNQRKRSILFLLFTAGLFAGVLFCTETTQAKVKTTIKNSGSRTTEVKPRIIYLIFIL